MADCSMWADPPDAGTTAIIGRGHRECVGTPAAPPVAATVRLRQQRRLFPDRTLASVELHAASFSQVVRYDCEGRGSQLVFTEVVVDLGRRWGFFRKTAKVRSAVVAAALCS